MSRTLQHVAFAVALLVGGSAYAKPKIEIAIQATKEVVEVGKDGQKKRKVVPAQKASAGELVQYTITYTNSGDEVARNAVIDDPVPEGTVYQGDSATGAGTEITFSNDGGKTFAPAPKLTYEMKLPGGKVEKRTATPSEYTHIRWTVAEVPPRATGKVSFTVKVK